MSHADNLREAQALVAAIRANEVLSEADFVAKCLNDMLNGWVPLAHYVHLFPCETANKVHKRVHQGTWQRQVHYASPEGGPAWVNLPAIRLWIEGRLTGK